MAAHDPLCGHPGGADLPDGVRAATPIRLVISMDWSFLENATNHWCQLKLGSYVASIDTVDLPGLPPEEIEQALLSRIHEALQRLEACTRPFQPGGYPPPLDQG